jgi:hypothetical protein
MENNLSLIRLKNLLKPMGNVISLICNNFILFQIDNIVFCKMTSDKLYFVDQYKNYKIVKSSWLNNSEQLLKHTMRSFHFAASYKQYRA